MSISLKYIKTYVNTDNVNKSKIYQNVRKY